jgi:hypothetical protein
MNIPMKSVVPSTEHLLVRGALERILATEAANMPADQILALVAHFLGQLIALQDHRVYTLQMVQEVIQRNIEQGNREMVEAMTRQQDTPEFDA